MPKPPSKTHDLLYLTEYLSQKLHIPQGDCNDMIKRMSKHSQARITESRNGFYKVEFTPEGIDFLKSMGIEISAIEQNEHKKSDNADAIYIFVGVVVLLLVFLGIVVGC